MVLVKIGNLNEGREFRKITFARSVIFFFDVFLALMIIGSASFLFQSEIGRFGLAFGFSMLILTLVLRILRKW